MPRPSCRRLLLALIAIGGLTNAGLAQNPDANRGADAEAIRKAAIQYFDAVKRNDARALAAAWTADGDYIDLDGNRAKARELIAPRADAPAADQAPREFAIKSSSVRFITADVAIEDGISELQPSEGSDSPAPIRYTAIWLKHDGKWLLDSLRESPAPETPVPAAPPAKDLEDLAWMIGDWKGSVGTASYEFSSQFLDNKTVLERKFKVFHDQGAVVDGTQFVTLDPESGAVTSQSVDSLGTRAACTWIRDDDGVWHAESEAQLADGRTLRSSNYYIPGKDGTWSWTVLDATLDGEPLPDLALTMKPRDKK